MSDGNNLVGADFWERNVLLEPKIIQEMTE